MTRDRDSMHVSCVCVAKNGRPSCNNRKLFGMRDMQTAAKLSLHPLYLYLSDTHEKNDSNIYTNMLRVLCDRVGG